MPSWDLEMAEAPYEDQPDAAVRVAQVVCDSACSGV